ncbi:MAG TPA: type III-A CRISPR-associated RAMP protein Csm5 [Bacteroidales bacterium]|nr:type III-A CRISPR-associated RAMP protein Csm5 [Bacteroidales bacterium]
MKVKLTTLTPVHIGNGTTLNKNIDFLQFGDKLGKIDERKIFDLLGEQQLDAWSAAIIRGDNSFIELLRQKGFKTNDLEAVCSMICNLKSVNNNSTQLKEHFRSPLKGLTIPGSSIKGAIRTAIFSVLIDDLTSAIKSQDMKNHRGQWSDANLEKKIFGENANEKSTRFIKVRDAHFENTTSDVFEVKILNANRHGWRFKEGQQFLMEAIPARVSCEFDIVVDTHLLEKNKIAYPKLWPEKKVEFLTGDIADLCYLVNGITEYLISKDIQTLGDENFVDADNLLDDYQDLLQKCKDAGEKEMILRLGGQSGYLFTTTQWMGMDNLTQMSDGDFNDLRAHVQRREYSHMEIWPKTRKLSSEGQLFGFIKISFE